MVSLSSKISFAAPVIRHGGMNAGYVEFPFSVEEVFGTRGMVKVKALFDGKAEYRGIMSNMGTGCHILILTQEVRRKLGKSFGDSVLVELEHDLEKREVTIHEDVQNLLNEYPEAQTFFEKLSYTHRKEYINWITSAKREETRTKRMVEFIEKLLQKKKPDQK
ncbi:MAG: YdeI/OmpD-associated family protein [Prolixibacteraceae bacterium]|nr:YdeI/OmpD-associated family protein [Prolixibacteraceae bacterium]